jgi:NAD-dependent dihydropyrimidine dehydrogenase PreA subunit
MALREIIRIDEDLCNGCGNCVTGCHEGALEIIDGKARLVRESFCDGLGACIGTCPTGALTIEKREANEFDEAAVEVAMAAVAKKEPAGTPALPVGGCPGSAARTFAPASTPAHGGGCPGSMQRQFAKAAEPEQVPGAIPSQLAQWPIQLHLIHPLAPQFQGGHLLVAADCTAFAFGAFHPEFLKGKALVIACPKLDDDQGYLEKLTDLFTDAKPASVTVARMEVPCCGGLVRLVVEARDRAESTLKVNEVIVGVQGGIVGNRTL